MLPLDISKFYSKQFIARDGNISHPLQSCHTTGHPMEKKKCIRPLALCVFRRGDKIFVAEGHDAKANKTFYRPIGGGIDFGERAIDTVRREVQEEIAAEVSNLVYLGTLEN